MVFSFCPTEPLTRLLDHLILKKNIDLGQNPIVFSAVTGNVVKKLVVPPNTETMMSQVPSSFDTPIPRLRYDRNGGIVSSLGDGMIHRWSANGNAWKSQLFSQSGSFKSILTHPSNDSFLTIDGNSRNNLRLWNWTEQSKRLTLESKQIIWAQYSNDGKVIKTENKMGQIDYWSAEDLRPLDYVSASFTPRLKVKGGSVVNVNASAEEIYMSLGKLPIRVCPKHFQVAYVVEEVLDPESAFVPEDLVPKYCPTQ